MPPEASHGPDHEVTLFHPSEMELGETTKLIFEQVRQIEPVRVVFDSLSEMRLLAQNSLRYRRHILALKHFFAGRKCTVLVLDDLSSHAEDLQLHSIAHGVISPEQLALDSGAERRRLRIAKMRGIAFRGGYHDFIIEHGGLSIFPRLVAAEHHKEFHGEPISSGSEGLDALLGGGLHRGTSALLIGGAGVGKSTVALTYAVAQPRAGNMLFSLHSTKDWEPSLPARIVLALTFAPISQLAASLFSRLTQLKCRRASLSRLFARLSKSRKRAWS